VAGRHAGLRTDHEPVFAGIIVGDRVAILLDENVPERLRRAAWLGLDGEHHRRVAICQPVQDWLRPSMPVRMTCLNQGSWEFLPFKDSAAAKTITPFSLEHFSTFKTRM